MSPTVLIEPSFRTHGWLTTRLENCFWVLRPIEASKIRVDGLARPTTPHTVHNLENLHGEQIMIKLKSAAAGRGFISLGIGLLLVVTPLLASGARAQDEWPEVLAASSGPSPFGLILTDPAGWTLYTWDGDEPGRSYCDGECASVWLPYVIQGDPVSPEFPPGLLGLIDRTDGTWQVSYEGWPLYWYAGDSRPGDTRGEGRVDLAYRWYVVTFGPPPPVAVAPEPVAGLQTPPSVTVPEPLLPPAFSPPPGGTRIGIGDYEFRPSSVNVQVGDTIVWTNGDATLHTATSDMGWWDTGPLGLGQTGSYTFATAGTFSYHCAFHSWMRGSITVFPAGPPELVIPGYPYETGVAFSPYSPYTGPVYPYVVGGSTLTVVAPPSGVVALSWVASPTAQSYRIYQTTLSQPLNFQIVRTISQSLGILVTNATVAGLAPGTPYLFQVRAVDATGAELLMPSGASVGPIGALPPFPEAPTGLVVTGTPPSSVTLSWTAAPGAYGYQVLQALSATGPYTPHVVTSSSATTATVTGLAPNTTYYFQVRAIDSGGNLSLPSNTVDATPGSTLAPPAGLTVLGTTRTTAVLTWSASPGAAWYVVYQALTPAGAFTISSASMASLTSASVTGLTPNTTYYFQVRGFAQAGTPSLPSNTVAAVTAP